MPDPAVYLLKGPGAAFLVALGVLIAGRRSAAAAALAIALGAGAAQGLLFGWPDLPLAGKSPDPSTEQRLVLGYALLSLLGPVAVLRGPLGLAAKLLACLALPPWLLWFVLKQLETMPAVRTSAGLGLALAAVWTLSELAARRRSGPGVPAGIALAGALGSGAFLFGASATAAEQAGALCGAIAAAALLSAARRDARIAEGAAGPAAAALALLSIHAWRLNELSATEAALVGLAPAGALLGIAARGRAGIALAMLGPALPAATALLASYLTRPADPYSGY